MHRHTPLERIFWLDNTFPTTCGAESAEVIDKSPGEDMMPEATEAATEDAVQGGEDVVRISDEIEPLKQAPSPSMPSAAEVEEHRVTHIPYRSWCRECVMGRGLGEQRGRHHQREHDIAIVGVDYFFITAKGVQRRPEMMEEYAMDPEGRRGYSRTVRPVPW